MFTSFPAGFRGATVKYSDRFGEVRISRFSTGMWLSSWNERENGRTRERGGKMSGKIREIEVSEFFTACEVGTKKR